MKHEGYDTPEEAALAQWAVHPQAAARVIRVEHEDENHAFVLTDTVPSHPMWNSCERVGGKWIYFGDSGPAWGAIE